ncbi:Predicted membrane protein [Ceraceosorus bombacis]|uniref:GDT1 family protein n=1 Tax=Ceraceosorus bombacis TaxID=401625 RepID=A0A0P1BN52_9BASI|nr:Predicted membrane protein [Ceraceosorus bombacis]
MSGLGDEASRYAAASSNILPFFSSVVQAAHDDPRALWSAFSMIIVSEIGDKTFLIAAILSMRHARIEVFSGAFSALALMSVLSALLGAAFPTLLPKSLTTLLAAGLFLFFGLGMLKDASGMTGDEANEEWREAEREVNEEEAGDKMELRDLEEGSNGASRTGHLDDEARTREEGSQGYPHVRPYGRVPPPDRPHPTNNSSARSASLADPKEGLKNLCGICFSHVFAQSFVLTFLGEWGDRSQIATIALGAAHSVTLISIGTIAGHAICTGVAVICGSWLARRISAKHVTLGGAVLFLLFGVIYFIESLHEILSSGVGISAEGSVHLPHIFAQSFVLTFLGEWGDRSQIATIALGAAHASRFTIKAYTDGAKWASRPPSSDD